MSDHSRSPYTPSSEAPLAFADRRPPRAGGPAPVTLILSLLLLAAVGGGVFYIYRGGARAPGEPPQPVGAPVRDVRIAAPPTVQPPDPAAGLSIYKDDQGASVAAPAFVAPPEQPTPRPAATPPSPPPIAPPVTSAAAPAAPAPAKAIAASPTVTPVKSAAIGVKSTAKPASIDTILAANSAVGSPAKPLLKSATKPLAQSDAASGAKPDAPSNAKDGPALVQIGAFSSKSLADASWNTAAGVAPGAMAGKGKRVAPITRPDGTTLYRTAITGFASRDDAVALCAKLKAAGESCIVR